MPVPAAQACLRAAVPKRLSCRPRLRFMVRHLRNAVARCISKHWLAARERAPRSLSPPSERRQAAGGVRCSSMCPAGTSRSRTGDTNTTLFVSEALAVHGSKPFKHCRPHFAANDRHAYCSARTPWRIQVASGATRYSKAEAEGARSLRRTIYIRCERGLARPGRPWKAPLGLASGVRHPWRLAESSPGGLPERCIGPMLTRI